VCNVQPLSPITGAEPSESLDYYQAIGRAARSGNVGETIIRFDLESLCQRLHPGLFLDGIGVPCVVLPHAQPCDICSPQLIQCLRDPDAAAPPALASADARKQLTLLTDPLEQPDPLASSATNLAAAGPCLDLRKAGFSRAEELIHTVGDNLAKSCVYCWSSGSEYHSHLLDECRRRPLELCSGKWRECRKRQKRRISASGANGAKPYGSLSAVASIAVVPKRFALIVVCVCSSHSCLDDLHIGFWPKSPCS
jgi:hypothetical protein